MCSCSPNFQQHKKRSIFSGQSPAGRVGFGLGLGLGLESNVVFSEVHVGLTNVSILHPR